MRIREGSSNDVRFLVAMGRDSSSAHWSERQYRALFECAPGSAPRLVLIAEEEIDDSGSKNVLYGRGANKGFLIARHVAPEWELENIVVSPAARRSKFGTLLLEGLIEAARKTNSEAVFLEVRESNAAARGLYRKIGFKQTGRRKSYYTNPLEDAILYRLDLS